MRFLILSYSICQANVNRIECAHRMPNFGWIVLFSLFSFCWCHYRLVGWLVLPHLRFTIFHVTDKTPHRRRPPRTATFGVPLTFLLSLLWLFYFIFIIDYYHFVVVVVFAFEGKNSIPNACQTKFDGTTTMILLPRLIPMKLLPTELGGLHAAHTDNIERNGFLKISFTLMHFMFQSKTTNFHQRT